MSEPMALPPGTMELSLEANAIRVPSAVREAPPEPPNTWVPFAFVFARTVPAGDTVRTNTSEVPFVSEATRLVAPEVNPMTLPSALMATPLAWALLAAPAVDALTRTVVAV